MREMRDASKTEIPSTEKIAITVAINIITSMEDNEQQLENLAGRTESILQKITESSSANT